MVDYAYEAPKVLSDADRVKFVSEHFVLRSKDDFSFRERVIDTENGHLVKLITREEAGFMSFAVKHYIKRQDGGKPVSLPAAAVKSLYRVTDIFFPLDSGRNSQFGTLQDAARYLKLVADFGKTPYARVPFKDPNYKPLLYPTLPWVRTERFETASNVRLAG